MKDLMAIPAAAAAAYRAAAQMATPAASSAHHARQSAGRQFFRLSSRARSRIRSTPSARANRPPRQQVQGKANMVDVVQSVNAAEITLDTVVAVRDKVVAAYQSIMNMPI